MLLEICTNENNKAPGLNKAIFIQSTYEPPEILAQTTPVYTLVNKSYKNVLNAAKPPKINDCRKLEIRKLFGSINFLKPKPIKAYIASLVIRIVNNKESAGPQGLKVPYNNQALTPTRTPFLKPNTYPAENTNKSNSFTLGNPVIA